MSKSNPSSPFKNQYTATRWTPKLRKELIEWLDNGTPKHNTDIIVFLRIAEKTFYLWKDQHEDFAEIVDVHKQKRKQHEISQYLDGKTSTRWFEFAMKCHYGEMEEAQRIALELKRKELDAKIDAGMIGNTSDPINISFNIKTKELIEGE